MTITRINYSDIGGISRLHEKYLPSLSSLIGRAYLHILYRALLEDSDTCIGFVARDNGAIVGAIFATKDLGKTQKQITRALIPAGIPHVIRAVFSGMVSWVELWQTMRFESALMSAFPAPYATIVTLFVTPTHRRHGVGQQLVRAVTHELRKEETSLLHVDTQKENIIAQQFYTTLGFSPVKEIVDSVVFLKKI